MFFLVAMEEYKETLLEKFFDGTAGKGPLQHTKMLSSQFCLLNQLWFDVFGDLSLQTCYSSVVYLKCLKVFFVFKFKTRTQSKGFDMNSIFRYMQ